MRHAALLFGVLLLTSSLRAGFIPVTPPTAPPASGTVTDVAKVGTQIFITWTGSIPRKGGQVTTLGSTPIMTVGDDNGHGTGSVSFTVPATSTSPNGVTQPVKDYIQYAQDPGPISMLMLEAFVPDPDGIDFDQYGFLDYINSIVGPGVTIWVPDLYSSTDPNSDAVLWEAVNLSVYMANLPAFNLGDTFNIVNGTVAGLPGMIFGTSEMTMNPDSPDGFDNPSPYTGTGFALSEHGNVVTPEPGSVLLIAGAVVALGLFAKSGDLTGLRLPHSERTDPMVSVLTKSLRSQPEQPATTRIFLAFLASWRETSWFSQRQDKLVSPGRHEIIRFSARNSCLFRSPKKSHSRPISQYFPNPINQLPPPPPCVRRIARYTNLRKGQP